MSYSRRQCYQIQQTKKRLSNDTLWDSGWTVGAEGDKGQRFVVQHTAGATTYAQSIWVRSERRTDTGTDTIVVIAPLRDSECMNSNASALAQLRMR